MMVDTSALRKGDVIHTHGMLVRLDTDLIQYVGSGGGAAWWAPGTVLNVEEVTSGNPPQIPPSFLTTDKWVDGKGWTTDRRDHWQIQGNDLASWEVIERDGETV